MLGPGPDDCGSLLSDVRSTLAQADAEYQRAMSHLDSIMRDMMATIHTRKGTRELPGEINMVHGVVKEVLREARYQLQVAEQQLDMLRGMVINLEHSW